MAVPDMSPAAIAARLANAPANGSPYNMADYLAAGNDPSADSGQGANNLATAVLSGNPQYAAMLKAAKSGDPNAQAALPTTAKQLLAQSGFSPDEADLNFDDPNSPTYGVGKDENTGPDWGLMAGIAAAPFAAEYLPGLFAGGGGADAAAAGTDAAASGADALPSVDLMSTAGSSAAADTAAAGAGAGGGGASVWSKILGGGPNQASNVPSLINAGGKLLSSLFSPQRQGFSGANSPDKLLSQFEGDSNEIGNALRERAASPITMPGANISVPRVSIPGLDVPNIGGTNISVKPYTQPGLDLSQVFGQPNPLVPKNNG